MKISKLLRIIPVIFALAAAASIFSMGVSVSNERSYYNEEKRMNELGDGLLRAVEFLNEQARCFVEFGDARYFDAYTHEAYRALTREKSVMAIELLNVPEDEAETVKRLMELSAAMGALEERAMSEAGSGSRDFAREIILGDEYMSLKQSMGDTAEEFRTKVAERYNKKINDAAARTNTATAVLLAAAVGTIAAVFLSFMFLTGKIKDMTEMAEIAQQIARGDFDVDMSKYESRDEFGMLAKSLHDILNTVEAIKGEIERFIGDKSVGSIVCRVEPEKFLGSWSRILNGLNDALQGVRVQIIENAPVAYIVVENDIIVDCNRYAVNELGMAVGEPIEPHYEFASQRYRILRKLDKEGIVKDEQATFIDVNGEPRRYTLFINVIRRDDLRTVIVWGMDTEDAERGNDAIRRSQEDLRKLLDALPTAMTVEDKATGKINYANAAFYKLMGIMPDSEQINGNSLYAAEQSDGLSARSKEERLTATICDVQVTAAEEFTYLPAHGEKIDARVTAGEIMYNGTRAIIKVIQDIGEEKLKRKLLEDAAEHEHEANRLKSRFLANMSHEIRTPMNTIIGFAQIALKREQDSQNLDTYRKIYSSAKNLLTIINDILDFSKIEAQKIKITEELFVLEDVVANAFLVASERIEDKRVEMLLDIQPELPVRLVGDKTRLWQILKNLLDNSAKYTESGFIILKISEAKRDGENRITLSFQLNDTGIGMTDRQLEELFVPFSQFSDSYKYKTSGTGLGMSITKELVELLEGEIKVSSEVGAGTQITVNIGFKLGEDATTLADAISRDIPAKYSVLIADDDPVACEIMARILNAAGFETEYAHSGEDAISAAGRREAEGKPFNIIILDYILGKDDGIEIGRRISQRGNHSKLLMVSAYVKRIPEELIHEVGFKDVLQKPFIPSMLVKRLYDTLDDHGIRALTGKGGFKGARVLLCEDNPLNQEIAVEMLRLMGIEPDVAADGEQCIDMLEKREYDLVLMDVLMPVMDGVTATKIIRGGEKAYSGVHILAMTANVMREHVEEFTRAGMEGYIPKPVEFDVLYDMLARYLPQETLRSAGRPPRDEAAASFSVAGVEVSEGLARFGGNEERYRSALMRFAEQKREYDKPDGSKEFSRYIHTLKGVSANLGINAVAAMAKKVEGDLQVNRSAVASFEVLMAELGAVSARVKSKVGAGEKKPRVVQSGTRDEYLECVAKLKETVATANITDSDQLLNRLVATRWQDVPEHDFMPVAKALADYDFSLAEKLLQSI